MIDFFVIGAARCGTSSIFRCLSEHPGVHIPDQEKFGWQAKEPRFFTQHWNKGWSWYREIYADRPEGQIVGDFSPQYSNFEGKNRAAERIANHCPQAKIIYMVRNPIDCALSNWRMAAHRSEKPVSFGEAFRDKWSMSVLHRARFFYQLSHYRQLFPDERILVIPLEAIQAAPREWLQRVQNHLELENHILKFPRSNTSNQKKDRPGIPQTTLEEREGFLEIVKPDSIMLLRHLGLPDDFWEMTVDYKGWGARPTQQS